MFKRLMFILLLSMMIVCSLTVPAEAYTDYAGNSETYTFWKWNPDYGWKTFSYYAYSKTGWYDSGGYRITDYGHVLLYIRNAYSYPRWEINDNAALYAFRLYEGTSLITTKVEDDFTGPGESYLIPSQHLVTFNKSISVNYALTISNGPKNQTVTYWECSGWLDEMNSFEYNLN